MENHTRDALTNMLRRKPLRHLAGERSFGRGEVYFTDGAVRSLQTRDEIIEAKVQGTRTYRVRLWVKDSDLEYSCTCPFAGDGNFCKHCVAAGLAWIAEGGDVKSVADAQADIGVFLHKLKKDELVSMLLEQAENDDRFRRRLVARAAGSGHGDPDLSVWRQAFDEAISTYDFVSYQEAHDHMSGIEEVIESIEQLLEDGHAQGVIELAEYGLEVVEEGIEHVDDSDGEMSGLLERLQDLHLAACRRAAPDPEALAERLFEWEMETDYDTFYRAARTYADILGEAGLAVYRRLAQAEWAKVPALVPGEKDPDHYGRRFRITSVMETLAQASGDIEKLIAVKSRDLSRPHDFLRIAEIYQQAGKPDKALEWAERGWNAFPKTQRDGRLREFIAQGYHRRDRHDAAMAMAWEAFFEWPDFGMYTMLEMHARKARQWPAWRDKALSAIRDRIGAENKKSPERNFRGNARRQDHSVLVEVFLYENDVDTAWREARQGGCSKGLWLELAKRREKTHAADSVEIYRSHIAGILQQTGNRAYEEAVKYLERLRKLLLGSGREAAFADFVGDIRKTHKRKRNLMKMLDHKAW